MPALKKYTYEEAGALLGASEPLSIRAFRISVLRVHRYIVSLLRNCVLTMAYTHGIVHTSGISA
jgi:hypothetical protein